MKTRVCLILALTVLVLYVRGRGCIVMELIGTNHLFLLLPNKEDVDNRE